MVNREQLKGLLIDVREKNKDIGSLEVHVYNELKKFGNIYLPMFSSDLMVTRFMNKDGVIKVNVFDYNNITYSSDLIDIEIDYNEFDDLLAEIDEIYTLQAKEEDRDGFLYDLKIFEERLENADEEDRAGIEEDIADCKEEISDVEKEIADLKSRIAKRSATDGQ